MTVTAHVDIPVGAWFDLSSSVGENARVSNSGEHTLIYVVAESDPGINDMRGFKLYPAKTFDYVVDPPETIWIRSLNYDGIISATPDLAVRVLNESLNVHDADVHSTPVNELFHQHTGISTTISVDVLPGDTSISVASTSGFSVGDNIQISTLSTVELTHPVITNISSNVFTLDRPLDLAMPIGASVDEIIGDISVVGSLISPQSFKLIPNIGETWHITSLVLHMSHTTSADDSRLGNIAGGVANGIVIRVFNGMFSRYRTFTNIKTNADIALNMGGVTYNDKAGGGNFSTLGSAGIKAMTGAVPSVSAENGDFMEVLVQDDISSLVTAHVRVQGHLEKT